MFDKKQQQQQAAYHSIKQANLGNGTVAVSSTTTATATPLETCSADVVCVLVLIQNDDGDKRNPGHEAAMTMQQP